MGNKVTDGYMTTADLGDLEFTVDMNKLIGKQFGAEMASAFEKGLNDGMDEAQIRLTEKMQEYISEMGLGGSELAGTVFSTRTKDEIDVGVGADYAIYVEYGTGIVGSENPHPAAKNINWQYNIGETINPVTGYWRYPKGMTRGQEHRPFMYRTVLWGKRSIYNIVRKHIRKQLKALGAKY